MPIQYEIEKHLEKLIGLPLSAVRRAADMRTLSFGILTPVANGSVGKYALHIQCPWRIESQNTIITGSADLWEPIEVSETFDWDTWDYEQGNLQDVTLDAWFHNRIRLVQAVSSDSFGGAILHFSDGDRLVVFPNGARGEQWRLFQPHSDEPHLIVGDKGVIEDV